MKSLKRKILKIVGNFWLKKIFSVFVEINADELGDHKITIICRIILFFFRRFFDLIFIGKLLSFNSRVEYGLPFYYINGMPIFFTKYESKFKAS